MEQSYDNFRMYYSELNAAERHALQGVWTDKAWRGEVIIAFPTSLDTIAYMVNPWLSYDEQMVVLRLRKKTARRRARRALGRGHW